MLPIPPLSFTGGTAVAEGAPLYGAPVITGGGVWNVATSGSRADNTGSASASASPAAADAVSAYLPYLLGALALLVMASAFKK